MPKNIIITGASSWFGALTARALGDGGHTVYAGMRDVRATDAQAAAEIEEYARSHDVAVRPLAMDVTDDAMVAAAVQRVVQETDGSTWSSTTRGTW